MPEENLGVERNASTTRTIEALPVEPKRSPWRPRVAGISAMFFGPVAGGLVCAINFKRMGQEKKARLTIICSLLFTLLFVALIDFVLPDNEPLIRGIGLGVLVAGFVTFSNLQENDFETWSNQNQESKPANGWSSIGWGLLGLLVLLVIVTVLAMFTPSV